MARRPGYQRRFKRKPRISAYPPIPDMLLRRTARRPNRLTRDEARRMAGGLHQAAGAAALVAADERGVRWLQPHIHDSPRNQLKKYRHAVHVSVNKALAVCDGFSKLLKTLRSAHKVKCVSVTPARIFILGVGIAV
jgi:hypothetical protein